MRNINYIFNSLFLLFLSCSNGFVYDFCLDTYPPGSEPTNGDWQYELSICTKQDFAGGSNTYGTREFDISICDSNNKDLFQETHSFTSAGWRRIVTWNIRDSLNLKIVHSRYDFNLHQDIDSALILHELIVYKSGSNKFAVDTVYYIQ